MIESGPPEAGSAIAAAVSDYRRRGVSFWLDGGQLHYRSPAGSLTGADIENLRVVREQLVAFLRSSSERSHYPLGFSQLWHWEMYRRTAQSAGRTTASVLRFRGPLIIEWLRQSIRSTILRHDALAARIRIVEGHPMQEICVRDDGDVRLDDLTHLKAENRLAEAMRLIRERIEWPIDPTNDSLFEFSLVRCAPEEHILIVATDHLISDATSLYLLLRDICAAYTHLATGTSPVYSSKPTRFFDYCLWQREYQDEWVRRDDTYWRGRLKGWQDMRLAVKTEHTLPDAAGWSCIQLHVAPDICAALRDWSRRNRTTMVMGVLTAYAALLLRWLNTGDVLIQYQTSGRTERNIDDTVGYLASLLGLRVRSRPDDRLIDLLARVTEEYCEGHERGANSYLAVQTSDGAFARTGIFNWVPQTGLTESVVINDSQGPLLVSPIPVEELGLDTVSCDLDPEVIFKDYGTHIQGGIYYPRNRFSSGAIRRFAQNFHHYINTLVGNPETLVADLDLI